MRTLYLMRHAKSSWDDPDSSDFERPLNPRGLAAARAMGGLMRERALLPQYVLSSPATRARQTAEIVVESSQLGLPINYDERIYEASALSLFNLVRELDDRYASALVIGHNPGFEQLVFSLTREPVAMPTAALAVIKLASATWPRLDASINDLKEFIRPREL